MPPRAARVIEHSNGSWENRHRSFQQPYDKLYDVWNPEPPVTDFFGDLKLTVAAIQKLIADAIRDGRTLRAIGGGWSLSKAAVTDGRLINTAPLNWYFPVRGNRLAANFPGDPSSVFFLQCGVSVAETNAHLFSNNPQLALKTSGASNGQTIVGAVSTGTHGSAFQVGAMQDYVSGLYLIPRPDRALWIERASRPVLANAFVTQLGADLVRDDAVFNDALVSFGSFGVLFGVAIEAVPLYLLEASRQRLPLDEDALDVMHTLDLARIPTPYPNETPYHFDIVVNPHDTRNGAYVTTMYKRPYRTDYPRPRPSADGRGPGDDLLAIVGKLGDRIPNVVIPVLNTIMQREYRTYDKEFGTPGEIFAANLGMQKAMSAEIGVPLARATDALEIMLALPELRNYPGVLAFRYVPQSGANLAFTKFPTTCTIEFPSGFAQITLNFLNAAWTALENAGLPFTLHWGQQNNFTPARVRAMYGDAAVDHWIATRNQLLDAPSRAVFSSAFLQQCGLG